MISSARSVPVPRLAAFLEVIAGIAVLPERPRATPRPTSGRLWLDHHRDDGSALMRSLPLAFVLSTVLWTVVGGLGIAVVTIVA